MEPNPNIDPWLLCYKTTEGMNMKNVNYKFSCKQQARVSESTKIDCLEVQ